MRDVKRFPTTTGLSWLEMSSFKDHLFKGHEKIGKEYDYVIVGGGYGGYALYLFSCRDDRDQAVKGHPDMKRVEPYCRQLFK